MPKTYDVGDMVRLHGKYSTSTGSTTYKNPVTVYLEIVNPAGTKTTDFITTPTTVSTGSLTFHTLTVTSSGEFYYDLVTTGSGRYNVRWSSTGTITTAGETGITVQSRTVT